MTPVRAVLAATLAVVMVVAGSLIVARTSGREAGDLLEILLAGPAAGLWCFLAAAGALAVGAAGVLTAFLAFIAREEEDAGPFRRRGFPKAAPIILILLALGLVWLALRCAGARETKAPVAVALEPEAPLTADLDGVLEGGDPIGTPAPAEARLFVGETAFIWPYKDPMVEPDGPRWLSNARPFADDRADGDGASLLCGKAWVAVTSAASEEGPAARNVERARLRTLAAMDAARRYLGRNAACGTPVIFGIDFGQHAPSGRAGGEATTAYQRLIMVIARDARESEALTEDGARAELEAYLADPAAYANLLGGRRFLAGPVVLAP